MLAKKIVEMLDEKKAFRESLPMHLDKRKFLFLVEDDIKTIIAEDWEVVK